MPKPFVAFDVDGTIFKSSLAEKVVDTCITHGVFQAEPFNEVYASKRRWQMRNKEGLYQAYIHRLVSTIIQEIGGVDVEQFHEVTETMLEEHTVRKFGFPRQLLSALRPTHYALAISGSPDILVEPFLKDLQVDAAYGSKFLVEDGRFTGQAFSIGDKSTILKDLLQEGVATQVGSVAIGDTFSDIPMLNFAAHPIMFNASKTLTDYGAEFGWLRVNEVKDNITALEWNAPIGAYVEADPDEIIGRLRGYTPDER